MSASMYVPVAGSRLGGPSWSTARTRARVRLTPLGRLVVALALATAGAVAGAAGATATRPAAESWRCVVVRPGDTLWGLARAVEPRGDPRVVVARIASRNRLDGTSIAAGDALWVPWNGSDLPPGSECGTVR